MDKINILWIEDNPLQESVYVMDLINRDPNLAKVFSEDLYQEVIPAIHLEGDLEEYHRYFHLQVLQHPIEIKDFITMCLKLEDTLGVSAFKKLDVLPPEVITFDYHFGSKIKVNQGSGAMIYDPRLESIRRYVNPNFKFIDKLRLGDLFSKKKFLLEQIESENYTEDDFLREISKTKTITNANPKDKQDLIEDDFGLLSAIEILRIFREHVTVAIPATFNKKEVEKLTLHGKYFEWLNEYDYSIDFQREERGSKKWDAILKDAVRALQKKIEMHSKLGKMTFDLHEILRLAAGYFSENEQDSVLTIHTVYGQKKLPLNGLFINAKTNKCELQGDLKDELQLKQNEISELQQKANKIVANIEKKQKNLAKNSSKQKAIEQDINLLQIEIVRLTTCINGLNSEIELLKRIPENERHFEIWKFSRKLLHHFFKKTKIISSVSIINEAQKYSQYLLNGFADTNKNLFWHRAELSKAIQLREWHLAKRGEYLKQNDSQFAKGLKDEIDKLKTNIHNLEKQDSLNQREITTKRAELTKKENLLREINDKELWEKKGKKYEEAITNLDKKISKSKEKFQFKYKVSQAGNETFTISNSIEISSLINKSDNQLTDVDKSILYWTTLMTIINAYKIRQNAIKDKHLPSLPELTRNEILMFLYPVASTPAILPIHNEHPTNWLRFINIFFPNFESLFTGSTDVIDIGEKYLVNCYAQTIKLEDDFRPIWLK